MKIKEDGHIYELQPVGNGDAQYIKFIKRNSGAVTHDSEHGGTNTQELIRVAIHRSKYLNNVLECRETSLAIKHLRTALYLFEKRAWRRKNQKVNKSNLEHTQTGEIPFGVQNIEYRAFCRICGHVCCDEHPSD